MLLEPIMKVEVVTPEEHTGFVMGDLLSRRGHVQGQDMRANAVVINAMVPLSNMFGYVNQLRSGTQGRANFTMQFDHYEQVPANIAVRDHREIQVRRAIRVENEGPREGVRLWPRKSLRVTSPIATLARSAMSTMARRR